MSELFMHCNRSCLPLHQLARFARSSAQPKSTPWARMKACKGTASYRDQHAAQSQLELPTYIRDIDGNSCTLAVHARPGAKVESPQAPLHMMFEIG